jgi:dimethylamine/trimethylamine dehydrogenase
MYYMGGVMAETLLKMGCRVTLVTPSVKVSEWTTNTLEQGFIQQRLLNLGVNVRVTRALISAKGGEAVIGCTYTGRTEVVPCDAILMATARLPVDGLLHDLKTRKEQWVDNGIESVRAIGDAEAPSSAIAWSTYAGHRYAEELDEPEKGDALPFRREIAEILT